ncbi:MAG: universal stress protein [Chloroflexota bacterium]|nr:universal stress protein [Chloroflexota bacterium]
MISSVLVPLDGSPEAEQAIPYALTVLPNGGHVLLFTAVSDLGTPVASDPDLTGWQRTPNPGQEAAYATELNSARAALQQIVSRKPDVPANWSVEVALGDPASQILQTIAQREVDLVAMTTHGRGALGRIVFGSVADRIARTSPVPVLLVRPELTTSAPETATITRLLVPLDGSERAEAALPVATALAQRLAVPIHLVRATNSAQVLATLGGGGPFPAAPAANIYDQLGSDLEREATTYLSGVTRGLQAEGLNATCAVGVGSVYAEIANAIKPGDLLVMTSHGRSGVMRWLLGSVAEKLVREAPAPVLLVPAADRGTAAAEA